MNEESLFVAALEKTTAAERQAFLYQACAGDPALRLLMLRCFGLGPERRERCRGSVWTIRESGTRVWPRTGPRLIARGASPWYAGAITLEYNAALKRAEVPVRRRERLVREGLALFAVPRAREPLANNRDPIRG